MTTALFDENPLVVSPSLAAAIGLNESIILQQMHYWLKRSDNYVNGRRWIYNTYEEWSAQFPFWKPETVRKIIAKLRKMDLVCSEKLSKNKWDKTNWYSINYENLSGILSRFDAENYTASNTDNHTASNTDNHTASNTDNHTASDRQSVPHDITETTRDYSETTTEIDNGSGEPAKPSGKSSVSRKVSLPGDFKPNEQHADQARKTGVDLNHEFEQFKDYSAANAKKYADWNAAFRNWLRNAAKFAKNKPAQKGNRPGYMRQDFSDIDYSKGINEDGTF